MQSHGQCRVTLCYVTSLFNRSISLFLQIPKYLLEFKVVFLLRIIRDKTPHLNVMTILNKNSRNN